MNFEIRFEKLMILINVICTETSRKNYNDSNVFIDEYTINLSEYQREIHCIIDEILKLKTNNDENKLKFWTKIWIRVNESSIVKWLNLNQIWIKSISIIIIFKIFLIRSVNIFSKKSIFFHLVRYIVQKKKSSKQKTSNVNNSRNQKLTNCAKTKRFNDCELNDRKKKCVTRMKIKKWFKNVLLFKWKQMKQIVRMQILKKWQSRSRFCERNYSFTILFVANRCSHV